MYGMLLAANSQTSKVCGRFNCSPSLGAYVLTSITLSLGDNLSVMFVCRGEAVARAVCG